MTSIALRDTRMFTCAISPTSVKNARASTAAWATVWANWPSVKRLVKQCMIPNGAPPPPSFGSPNGLRLMRLKKPSGPSNTWAGPVMPPCASSTAKIAVRAASAAAPAFQFDSVPTRV